jgi:hypothetical protein
MGAWAYGNFANDDALDWVGTLTDRGSAAIIQALSAVSKSDEYLDAPFASAAIAAAEVVAALAGSPAATLPPEVSTWVASQPKPTQALLGLARGAVERVLRQ